MQQHLDNECPEGEVTCKKCDQSYKRKDSDEHDCLTALKAQISVLKTQNNENNEANKFKKAF